MTATPSFFKKYTEGDPLPVADDDTRSLLRRVLLMLTSPLGFDMSLQRQRGTVLVESGTVTTVTTVATVTNVSQLAGRNADMVVNANIDAAWALNVRSRIS